MIFRHIFLYIASLFLILISHLHAKSNSRFQNLAGEIRAIYEFKDEHSRDDFLGLSIIRSSDDFRALLQEIAAEEDERVLSKIDAYYHPMGFIKITLHRGDKGQHVRLHFWGQSSPNSPPQKFFEGWEPVHNHRWNFSSKILHGSLDMIEYEELMPLQRFSSLEAATKAADLNSYKAYSVNLVPGRDPTKDYNVFSSGQYALLRPLPKKTVEEGETYFINHLTPHRVLAAPGTATILLMDPAKKTSSEVFESETDIYAKNLQLEVLSHQDLKSYLIRFIDRWVSREKPADAYLAKETILDHRNLDRNILRAMSYNIRMAPLQEDEGTENEWKYRLPKVTELIFRYQPDVAGLQEISAIQKDTLKSKLDDKYAIDIVVPTRPPIESGLGFLYNQENIKRISEVKIVWLNEAGNTSYANAWDGSSYERFVIYGKFEHLHTKQNFWLLTTHFDHLGIVARQNSARIVMDLAASLDAPAIITGDFNCFPQLGGAELYQLLSSHQPGIVDSGKIAERNFGPPGTWIGWDYDLYKSRGNQPKYDFIFLPETAKVLQEGTIDDQVKDEVFGGKALYPSDHRPVMADFAFRASAGK